MVERKIVYNGKYQRIKKIGEGSYAIAFLVERLSDGLQLIAKVNKTEATFEVAKIEAERLASFSSRYIVKYYDSFLREGEDGDQFIIITEYCKYGPNEGGSDLDDLSKTHGGQERHLGLYKQLIFCIL